MIRTSVPLTNGNQGIIIGLTEENIRRLHAGDPINFDNADIGHPGLEIFIGDDDRK